MAETEGFGVSKAVMTKGELTRKIIEAAAPIFNPHGYESQKG